MEKMYVVIRDGKSNYYTDDLIDAKEKYHLMIEGGHKAEIVYGSPGHCETVNIDSIRDGVSEG